uniref:F4 family fimbrial subunit n=1 Tax=Escherichia coli TaxID=562 RepID=UPI001FCE3683
YLVAVFIQLMFIGNLSMKKTLIALAVAASAVVSGSAMASGWEQNGNGTSVEIGGTLQPVAKVTPWEVKTGNAVTNLNAQVQKGQTSVTVNVNQAIPVLGIRTTAANKTFYGQDGIAPRIDYGNAIDLDKGSFSVFPLTLSVMDNSGDEIGTLTTNMFSAAVVSRLNSGDMFSAFAYEGNGNYAFKGGINGPVVNYSEAVSRLNALDSTLAANFEEQGAKDVGNWRSPNFSDSNESYSAFYGSGIESGEVIKINLSTAVSGNSDITWKASLPVTVTYM